MSRGRKPAPTHLKVLTGEKRASRLNPDRAEAPPGRPQAPEWLGKEEVAEFEALVDRLEMIGIASEADDHIITLAAVRTVEVRELTDEIEGVGYSFESTGDKGQRVVKRNPSVAMRSEAMRHLHSLLSTLGLSPSDRGKVSTGIPVKKENPYEKLRRGS